MALLGICLSGCLDQSEDKSIDAIDTVPTDTVPFYTQEARSPFEAGWVWIDALSIEVLSAITIRDPEGTGTYTIRPHEGNVYIILPMLFENRDCSKFEIDPTQYVLVAGGIQYNPLTEVDRPYYVPTTGVDRRPSINLTYVVQPTGVTILDRMTLRYGGNTSGSLVYEVPSGAESDCAVEYVGGPSGCKIFLSNIRFPVVV